MQSFEWDDLRYCLALNRAGSLSAAGRAMGVSDTTVARRIKALETKLGASVFLAAAQGQFMPTPVGKIVLDRAEAMERESVAIAEAVGREGPLLADTVRISTVPILSNRVLLPALSALHQEHPELIVELVPDGRNLDLNKREADLALRFARPAIGGLKVKARRIGCIGFEVFESVEGVEGEEAPWITYDDTFASLPQARWMAGQGGSAAPLRVSDAETALEAAVIGIGRTVLPGKVGRTDRRLRVVDLPSATSLPNRDVWLLSHEDQNKRRAVATVKAWLQEIDW